MKSPLTVEADFHVTRRGRGARRMLEPGPDPAVDCPVGWLPRITRLMALAIRFEQLIQTGHVADYAELARLPEAQRWRIHVILRDVQELADERGLRVLTEELGWRHPARTAEFAAWESRLDKVLWA